MAGEEKSPSKRLGPTFEADTASPVCSSELLGTKRLPTDPANVASAQCQPEPTFIRWICNASQHTLCYVRTAKRREYLTLQVLPFHVGDHERETLFLAKLIIKGQQANPKAHL